MRQWERSRCWNSDDEAGSGKRGRLEQHPSYLLYESRMRYGTWFGRQYYIWRNDFQLDNHEHLGSLPHDAAACFCFRSNVIRHSVLTVDCKNWCHNVFAKFAYITAKNTHQFWQPWMHAARQMPFKASRPSKHYASNYWFDNFTIPTLSLRVLWQNGMRLFHKVSIHYAAPNRWNQPRRTQANWTWYRRKLSQIQDTMTWSWVLPRNDFDPLRVVSLPVWSLGLELLSVAQSLIWSTHSTMRS